jgi:hypothetical protein
LFRKKQVWRANERIYKKIRSFSARFRMPGSGLPDGLFSNQNNPNLDKFRRVLQWKMLVYVAYICYILRPFGIFYGHLVYLVAIWYIFSSFGMLYQEKSGNLGQDRETENCTMKSNGVFSSAKKLLVIAFEKEVDYVCTA